MAREQNPFIAVAIAAANSQGITLSPSQCKKLMRNDHFYGVAVEAVSLDDFNRVVTSGSGMNLGHFKKLGKLKKSLLKPCDFEMPTKEELIAAREAVWRSAEFVWNKGMAEKVAEAALTAAKQVRNKIRP